MPFETYLNSPSYSNDSHVRQDYSSQAGPSSSKYAVDNGDIYGAGPSQYHHASASSLQFQIPSFMMGSGPSVVAPGGGAEVLPNSYTSRQQDSAWIAHKGVGAPEVEEQSVLPL